MTRHQLTSQAEQELTEIISFIADDSVDAAEQVFAEFERAFRLLAENPGIGHRRADLSSNQRVRFWRVYSYLIVFLWENSPLSIVRIVSGHRDVAHELDGE